MASSLTPILFTRRTLPPNKRTGGAIGPERGTPLQVIHLTKYYLGDQPRNIGDLAQKCRLNDQKMSLYQSLFEDTMNDCLRSFMYHRHAINNHKI